ncbi:MAG: carboxy terminal-processing peptidase [Verrucomicrobia bacterium]|nr:carboxy terminal-processing peptidase [Verrucomicrobiota bacterium]
MFKSSILSLTILFSLLTPAATRAETNYGTVAMYVANMLSNHHLSHREFDEAMSKKVLDSYLNFLDFSHIYFTQKDVDGFRAKYSTTLPDYISKRNVSPAIEIYDLYEQRVKERVAFAKKELETKKYTFDSTRSIQVKRDKLPWPKNVAESDHLWSNLIESNMLDEHLADRAKVEAAARNKAKKEAKEAAAGSEPKDAVAETKAAPATTGDDPPEKRVAKRYEKLIEQLGENDHEDVVNYFLSCLSTSYDPHTEYMSQQEMDNFNIQMKHSLVGIGALLTQKDNVAEIQGIVVGGPADKNGELKLNDKIMAVAQGEGKTLGEWVDIKYMKLNKIVELIRGKVGTKVSLRVHPAAADDPSMTKDITIVRNEVELKEKLANAELIVTPPVDGKSSKIGWINLSSFYADMDGGTVSTTVDVTKLLKRLMAEKVEGVVLDLRGDGGGSLEEAIKLTGLFIPRGPVVQAKDWRDNITWRDCENERALYEGPLIVVTDRTSASASEILAAALQDYRRAIIVGEKATFGKGTVQTILPVERYMPFFSDKTRAGALKVTIQKFYRIAGGSTQLRGVIPDVSLPSIHNVLELGEDALPNALPYDTIPSRIYTLTSKDPLPFDELRARSKTRIEANPEFQYIMEDMKRLQDRIEKNSISLNDKTRQQELDENTQRQEARKADRMKRAKEIADTVKDGFQTYRLTLDNVGQSELMKESAFTKEQATGMKLASAIKDEDGESSSESSQFTYGIEPVKLETLNILRDLIDLGGHQPHTAAAGDATSRKPAAN